MLLKKKVKSVLLVILYAKQDVHLMTRLSKGQLPNLVNNGAITAVIILVTVKSNNCHLAIIRKGRQLEYSPCKFYLQSALHPKMSSNDYILSLITINSKVRRTVQLNTYLLKVSFQSQQKHWEIPPQISKLG